MLDDSGFRQDGGGDDERFDRLIESANSILTAAGEEAIGEAEEGLIGDACDDQFMMVDQVVDYIRGDRASRKEIGIPSGAM